jgi:hypothetical protein
MASFVPGRAGRPQPNADVAEELHSLVWNSGELRYARAVASQTIKRGWASL